MYTTGETMTVNAFLRIVLICFCLIGLCPILTLARPYSIRVAMDDNYPPFSFKDSDNNQQGILIDQWRLWEEKSRIKVEIHAMDWGKALSGMKAGEFDVIDTIFKTEERSGWLDFSRPYAKLEVPIFFDKDIFGITDAASLKGFIVAAKRGDAAVDLLKSKGVEDLVLFNSYEAVVLAAKEHKINVFVVDKPPALYFLHKFGIDENFRQSPPLNVGEFHRAVKKGNRELLETVEEGFRLIAPDELKKIETKWYGSDLANSRYISYFLFALGGLAILVLALFVSNRILRSMVNSRIAAQKASEDALRANEAFVKTLMDAIPVPIFYKDNKGRYIGFNSSFGEFNGLSQDDLIGKSVFDIAPRELAEVCHAKDSELFEHSGSQIYESQMKNASGEIRDVIFHKAPFTDIYGHVSGLIGAIIDITDRKKTEEERLYLERRLLHSQKLESLGVLSGGIAHDFNNLLQALLGNLDLALMRLPADAAGRKNIDHAVNAGKHAAKLTNMMLAYSGKGLFVVKPLNVTELVEENASMLEAAIPKSITLEKHLDHNLPAIMADTGQLQQVVMNLITNASEAIGEQDGKIRLSTGAREFDQTTLNSSRLEEKLTPGRYVWLKVCDSGCGMDEGTQQKLFDPFFTTKFTGRGLGMSAVLGIIRAHKGAFLVDSKPGVGTTIQVLLPISTHSKTERADSPASAGEPRPIDRHRWIILVIDDEEMIRGVCVGMLEELGFEVLSAASGEEALSLFRKQGDRIDLVLLDQVMPGMDGVAVFKELRRIRPEIKILLASGFSEQEAAERFKDLGLNGFIPKPFDLKQLAEELQQALKGQPA